MSACSGTVIGAMVCHPPLILPKIGGKERKKIQEIVEAYEETARKIAQVHPDTLVIITPHGASYEDYIQLSSSRILKGDLRQFQDAQDRFEVSNDRELIREMERLSKEQNFAMGTLGVQNGRLDHGTMVPLWFFQKLLPEIPVVRISTGGLSHLDHYQAGCILQQAAKNLKKRIAVIASSDLSHCQKEDGPYGFRSCGVEYDRRILKILEAGNFLDLIETPAKDVEEAMVCGHEPMCVLAGSLDGTLPHCTLQAHAAPFGVGYGMMLFSDLKPAQSRDFCRQAKNAQKLRHETLLQQEDPWISLARKSVESRVLEQDLAFPKDLPRDLLESQQAVFVSLYRDGLLRGCIGTTSPLQSNTALEIAANAQSACMEDPRFSPLRKEELEDLEIHVDVLSPPERCRFEQLDPKRYGVIVSKGKKRGVLLPDLEGIEDASMQLALAKQKAGLKKEESGYTLERFEVIRHEVRPDQK